MPICNGDNHYPESRGTTSWTRQWRLHSCVHRQLAASAASAAGGADSRLYLDFTFGHLYTFTPIIVSSLHGNVHDQTDQHNHNLEDDLEDDPEDGADNSVTPSTMMTILSRPSRWQHK